MGAGSQPKPVMIQKGMNAHKSVQANKIILLNNLKKKHPQQEDGELLRGVARRPPFVLKGTRRRTFAKALATMVLKVLLDARPKEWAGGLFFFYVRK